MVKRFHILVTGSNGQVGSALQELTKEDRNHRWTFWDRSDLDLSIVDDISVKIKTLGPDIIINCAAYTAVDQAESEVDLCFAINEKGVKELALICKETETKLIHISSDYVYHLGKDTPLEESDPTHPRGVYARSKRAGELAIFHSGCDFIIIRTSWVYGKIGNNFVKTILRLAQNKSSINVVNDQIGSLTWTHDLSQALVKIISTTHQPHKWNQVYNFSNQGRTNWADIAKKIVSIKGLELQIEAIPSTEYPTPAPRPLWSLMSSDKIIKTFDLAIPDWDVSLTECLKEL